MEPVISRTQLRLLQYIAKCIDETGCQPSYREICKEFGWASINAPSTFLNALEKKGVVEKVGPRAVRFDWRFYLVRKKQR